MKKTIIVLISIFLLEIGNAQIKVFSGGNVDLGPGTKMTIRWNEVRIKGWTDVIFDYNGSGGTPLLSPSSDWNLHVGTSTKACGTMYSYIYYYKNGIYQFSDRNLKENINYKLNLTDNFMKLKVAEYNYNSSYYKDIPEGRKNTYTNQKHFGLIAQEMKELYPNLVVQDSSTGLYAVNYLEFVPVLIHVVQQQNLQIEELKREVKDCCISEKSVEGGVNANLVMDVSKPKLYQNNPNPFTKTTEINYYLPESSKTAAIMIFDMSGILKKNIHIQKKGEGIVLINANELSAGMYYYSLVVDEKEIDTKKMILIN